MAQIKTNLQYGVTGSLQTGSIAGDAIDGTKIADDAINSEHLAAGGIDTAHIADDQITLAKMASGTDGNVITYDASGNPAVVATGTSGHFLKSQGAGSVPVFAAAGGNTPAFQASVGSGGQDITSDVYTKIQFSVEQYDSGSKYDNSTNYRFTPAESGRYVLYSSLTLIGASTGVMGQGFLNFYKNGAMFQEAKVDMRNPSNVHTGTVIYVSATNIVDSDADDYWEVYGKGVATSGDIEVRGHGSEVLSWFGGFKIA